MKLTTQQHALLGLTFAVLADQLEEDGRPSGFMADYLPDLDSAILVVAVLELRGLSRTHHQAAGAPVSD